VLKSNSHPVGSIVTKLWFLTKPSKFPNQPTDADRFADFAMKLKGIDPKKNPGYPIGNDIRTLLKERTEQQPARGTVIEALGIEKSKKADKSFIEVSWTHIPQAPEQVVAQRGQLDANPLYAVRGHQAPQQQQGYGQQMPYQGAPHPSQMANQYPAQQAQSPYPSAMPPQGYQMPTGPQPGGVYGAPPPAQYGQPMQSPVPQGPPQGGFVQQLPQQPAPQGPPPGVPGGNGQGGWGGGNQGGGW
jgi:hypothetical protein